MTGAWPATLRERLVPGAGWLLASAVLLALAQPPFRLLVPSFVALVPYLLWIEHLSGRTVRGEVLRGGFFFGLVYYGITLYWLVAALVWYTWLAVFAFLAPVFILSAFLAGMTLLIHRTRHRLGWPLWLSLPIFWTANEWLRAHLPDVAFPWMQLGDTLAGFPRLLGAADLVGSRGLSFWLAAVNGLLATLLLRVLRWKRRDPGDPGAGTLREELLGPSLALVLTLAAPISYSLARWQTLELREAATAAVIQPNVPEERKLEPQVAAMDALEATERLVERHSAEWRNGVDLVVLPETAFPTYIEPIPSRAYRGRPGVERWVEQLARGLGAGVLYGALGSRDLGDGRYEYYNSAFFVMEQGEAGGRYDKRRLVPVVERIPFLNPRWFRGLRYFGGFGVGRSGPLFSLDDARFGVLICYESIYTGLARRYRKSGADFLVNITNDAWFGRSTPWWSRTSALWQHPAHLVMRAVETRTGAVRSANTGISMIVDPLGRVDQPTELFTETAFSGPVYTTDGLTPYVRLGDVIGWAAALCALGLAVVLYPYRGLG